jgi:hypothetical protein
MQQGELGSRWFLASCVPHLADKGGTWLRSVRRLPAATRRPIAERKPHHNQRCHNFRSFMAKFTKAASGLCVRIVYSTVIPHSRGHRARNNFFLQMHPERFSTQITRLLDGLRYTRPCVCIETQSLSYSEFLYFY